MTKQTIVNARRSGRVGALFARSMVSRVTGLPARSHRLCSSRQALTSGLHARNASVQYAYGAYPILPRWKGMKASPGTVQGADSISAREAFDYHAITHTPD